MESAPFGPSLLRMPSRPRRIAPRPACLTARARALTGGLALAALACAGACGGAPAAPEPPPSGLALDSSLPIDARGERIEIPMGPAFREIALLEDQRTLGERVNGRPRLLTLLADPEPAVRVRAARALGRFDPQWFGSEVTDALGAALEDDVPAVRQEAAFGLGQRRDPKAAASLLAYLQDPDARLRARVVEAAAKLEGDALHVDLLAALRDEDAAVRMELADGAALWSRDEATAEEVDRALVDALVPKDSRGLPLSPDATAPELRWRLLHALARRGSPSGRGVFLERLGSEAPLDRLFAAMGLAGIAPAPEAETGVADSAATAALNALLAGSDERPAEPDWRVAVEACRALGALGDAAGIEGLKAAAGRKSPHVRAAAMTALGNLRIEDAEIRPLLRRAQVDLSRPVRAAAVGALARRAEPEAALELVEPMARSDDFVERGLAAELLGELDVASATELLATLVEDPVRFVGTRAVTALGQHDPERARPLLRALLDQADNGLRLAAVSGLAEHPDESDAPALIQTFRTTTGPLSNEVAFTTLRALAAAGGPLSRAVHLEAARDPRPHVRRVAAEGLQETFGQLPPAFDAGPLQLEGEVALPGRDFPRWSHNPLVQIETSKGRMVFELLPEEAPAHVHSFLRLAAAGVYDGLLFHRVVSDFVVQGGDPRGDGNGGAPARGEALRAEFGTRSFRRGALGMPRNEDPDSGGGQFFMTHRPTPHLDGRYTLFGRLVEGGTALDALELGDRILRVRLVE